MHLDDVRRRLARVNAARSAATAANADELELEHAFACGEHLAVYGSLAPGRENHQVLAGCPGTWTPGFTTGRVAERQFRVFTYAADGAHVAVQVLRSRHLRGFWRELDAFEGVEYRRILVPVFARGGDLAGVANLYEAVTPVARARLRGRTCRAWCSRRSR